MKIYKQIGGKIYDSDTQNWIITTHKNVYYEAILREVEEKKAIIVSQEPQALTWEHIRLKRNELLRETDWQVAADLSTKQPKKYEIVLQYRQELRDVPTKFKTPEEVVWPIKPE